MKKGGMSDFENVHPTETARRGSIPQADPARLGKDQSDEYRYYCKQCGASIDVRRDVQGDGNGNVYEEDTVGNWTRTISSGCWDCGSKNSI